MRLIAKESKTNKKSKIREDDKLLFELGEGFKKLSPEKEKELKDLFEDYFNAAHECTFSVDGSFDIATERFFEYLKETFKTAEEFIQAVGCHGDWDLFARALTHIGKDNAIYNYAKEYFYNIISSEENDKDFIEKLLFDDNI